MTREKARKILEIKRNTIATLGGADDWVEALDMGIKALSVPEREKGEWICIDEEDDKLNRYKCSRCGEIIKLSDKETLHDYPFSHCGANMKGGE